MPINHNYLRAYRKKAPLSLKDIAAILELVKQSNVARWEGGSRTPGLETLISLHLIYGVPIESFFKRQREEIRETLKKSMDARLTLMKALPRVPKLERRIAFLESALTRLNNEPT